MNVLASVGRFTTPKSDIILKLKQDGLKYRIFVTRQHYNNTAYSEVEIASDTKFLLLMERLVKEVIDLTATYGKPI